MISSFFSKYHRIIQFGILNGFELKLSKEDTAVIKAISILAIVFHNYFHNIPPLVGENEFFFSQSIYKCLHYLVNNPFNFIHPIASFFGHYGVHLFIFLSGYGLTKKVLVQQTDSLGELYLIIFRQIFKLIRLACLGFIVIVLYRYFFLGISPSFNYFKQFLIFLTFTENVVPDRLGFFITVWWFLALLVQLYLLFPPTYCLMKKYPLIGIVLGFVLLAYASQIWIRGIFIFSTPLTNLIIFVLGIYLALGKKILNPFIYLSFFLFPLSLFIKGFFPISFISFVCVAIFSYSKLHNFLNKRILVSIGGMSMYIYIVHGELRWKLLDYVLNHLNWLNVYSFFVLYLLEIFFVAFLCSYLVNNYNFLYLGKTRGSSISYKL